MFMTNYELVYGKQKTNSSSQNTPSPAEYKTVSSSTAEIDSPIPEQQHNAMQDAVGFIKSDNTKQKLGALSSKLKNVAGAAASTASGFAKNAVETAKLEETSSKIASFKEKAQSAIGGISSSVSGVGNKDSELLTSHKNNGVTESDALVSDNYNEDTINKVSNIPIFQEEPYHSQTKQTYNYSPTNENSSKKPIIIGIIAGLSVCAVFTAGLLCGQHLMKNNKNNNTPDNNDLPNDVANYSPKKYTIYDTSAAGSNFSFFNEPYLKIIKKNDPLNLRSAPSTSAEIILTMPKDSFVLLYGCSNNGLTNDIEWSYISYTKNGTTYYGYAASEYIG